MGRGDRMKYYSEEHEWVEVEEGVATIGITEYAAHELGDITFVELPEKGSGFGQGDVLCVVESVKAASDVFAPVSGRVTATNRILVDRPELMNESPEEDGWICKLADVDESELDNLMSETEYRQMVSDLSKE